ncbi:MAG: primase-helicase family protein [Limisphaerales bacterium]
MSIADTLPQKQVFYDAIRKDFYIENSRGGWITVAQQNLKLHLRAAGISERVERGEQLSPMEKRMVEIQTEYDVAYAGPLAGYKSGMVEQYGNRILVTVSPAFIKAHPGDCSMVLQLIRNLFDDEQVEQSPYVLGWLKIAVESLYSGNFRPGQALAIAGARGCGKSLLQNIITEILGGRSAKPYQYMIGLTPFNGELFGAEHLMVEDEAASTDGRNRRNFGSHIKTVCVNETQKCHGKRKDGITLKPFWRLSITLNDEPENLMILPELDESLVDKVMLLRAHKREMPMPTNTMEQRAAFMAKIRSELPAFIHYLNEWQIPEGLKSERFGITHYHHPELLESLDTLAPETKLLNIIDAHLFSDPPHSAWHGTAEDLENQLRQSKFSYEVSTLCKWQGATGSHLAKLASKYPSRFEQKRTNQKRLWTIKAGS